jgi:DNA-binding NarL/FixJ family response regulator
MKLLIVDDHPVFRRGMAALLQEAGAQTTVLQAANSEDALRAVEAHPDLDAAFIDLMMPGLAGEALIREFARRHPELPLIVLSSSENSSDVRRALNAGALGYVPKSASPQTLLSALQLVLGGNIYVPPLLLQVVEEPTGARGQAKAPNALAQLTERQVDVLRYLRDGLSNKEIAARLGIAEKTVKAHVAAIFRTLNVVNRTQAARFLSV